MYNTHILPDRGLSLPDMLAQAKIKPPASAIAPISEKGPPAGRAIAVPIKVPILQVREHPGYA